MWGVIKGVNYPLTLRKTFMVATEVYLLPLTTRVPSEAKVFPRIDFKFDEKTYVFPLIGSC